MSGVLSGSLGIAMLGTASVSNCDASVLAVGGGIIASVGIA